MMVTVLCCMTWSTGSIAKKGTTKNRKRKNAEMNPLSHDHNSNCQLLIYILPSTEREDELTTNNNYNVSCF